MDAYPDPSTATPTRPLPTGTVTFVFTDIEGSTQRWDRNRAAMEVALRRHDALVREAIATHRGYVFKTIGDAFCAAFARPEDAVAALFDAQRALAAEDFTAVDGLRVRAAIHTGTADERESDYFGPAVNRVARLLGIGHGGQVLVSGVTADLVQGSLPPGASLRDLGEHRLKDLSRPEYVHQLTGPGLIATFPPLRSLDALPNNLPRNATSFVGRETEIAEIVRLVEDHQLVTLVGSGGIGKTRISLHVAAQFLDGSGDGVWFVELAPLASGESIAPAIATVIGSTLAAEGDPLERLVRLLETKRMLLVFDNCEHLVDASARAIAAIVRGCAGVRVLASSRQALGIGAERTYRMPSLAVPSAAETRALTARSAARFAAIALFADRANAADDRFSLTDENAPFVADICRRLDGIALAIELAAVRVKILSPKQLRDRLDERFRVLTGGSRDVLPRQQTLRALIDWSHDLLDDRERTLFRRLGIFVDGFTLEGASAIASGDDLDELDAFDLLASLVDKSLVLAEPSGDALRYRLLESTRAYASEKLREAGEREIVAAKHLRYLRDRYAQIHERFAATSRNAEIVASFAADLEGVRFALDDALARTDVVAGAELLAVLVRITWQQQGLTREGIARFETFVAALPADEVLLRAKLSVTFASLLGDEVSFTRAHEMATAACAYARATGHGPTLANALHAYAYQCVQLGHVADAEAALDEAETIPDVPARTSMILKNVRSSLGRSDDPAAVTARYERQIAEQRALGNPQAAILAVFNFAEFEHARGETARAVALAREIVPATRNGTARLTHASLVSNLTGYLVASGDLAGAIEAGREVLAVLAREPEHAFVTATLEHLAVVDALKGRFGRAATLAAYVELAFEKVGLKRQCTEQTSHDRLAALLEAGLDANDRVRFTSEGTVLTPAGAVALALTAHMRE